MQGYLSNEFSFGPQQITAQAMLGSVAVGIPEPYIVQGEERVRVRAAALYFTLFTVAPLKPDLHMPRKPS